MPGTRGSVPPRTRARPVGSLQLTVALDPGFEELAGRGDVADGVLVSGLNVSPDRDGGDEVDDGQDSAARRHAPFLAGHADAGVCCLCARGGGQDKGADRSR